MDKYDTDDLYTIQANRIKELEEELLNSERCPIIKQFVDRIRELEAERDALKDANAELVDALKKSLSSFLCTQNPKDYSSNSWCNITIKLIAKAEAQNV